MSQHADTYFFIRSSSNSISNQVTDCAISPIFFQFRWQLRAFCYHYYREPFAKTLPLSHMFANLLDGKRNLRNEDHMCTTCDTSPNRYPSCIAPHDFNDHHAMVRLCRGMNLVNCIRRGLQSGIEAESYLGGGKIVVDGLRHTNQVHTLGCQVKRNFL